MKRSTSKTDLNQQVRVRVPADYPWKLLDQLVEDLGCSLDIESYNHIKEITRKRDYDSYMALSETWGPQSITSVCGTSVDKFFARYQASSFLRKFQFKTDKLQRRIRALENFKSSELNCLAFNQHGWRNIALPETEEALSVFTYAREFLGRLLGQELPERDKLTLWSRHGPGSNLDTQQRRISLYDKYKSWPYSCTRGTLALAREAIQDDERWLGALEDDYRRVNNINPCLILDQELFWSSVLKVVPGNRITFVPKNSQIDRSIAIEPCMNLYLQLGVDGYIRRRLKRYGVNLDDQSKNQELARLGSLNWESEDPFVTLDLAAASDSLSLELVRNLLPPQWYTYLIRLRSPVGVCGNEVFSYEKISSMGNGYTFALESAIFTAIVYGVEKTLKGRFNSDECAVYGDDIIVRRSSSLMVVQMLNIAGFSLNLEKSFISGPFRESCGADWFKGTLVRPVFLDTSPTTVMELWCDINRIRRILSLRYWGFEFKAVSLMEKWIPPQFSDCVGPLSDECFDSYKHVPIPTVRYRNGLWKFKHLVARPKSLKGSSFLFRKLMHSLRDTEPHCFPSKTLQSFGGLRVSSAGSRFIVTKPSLVTVSYSFSPASYWQDEYNSLPLRPNGH